MGADFDGLVALLQATGHKVIAKKTRLPSPTLTALPPELREQALECYRALQGVQSSPNLRPGAWDVLVDGVLVELDEELHFNRYRRVTLEAPAYAELALFPLANYRTFCDEHELECLKEGCGQKRWKTPSSERQFGIAGTRGDLSGAGAPRWRQRALYDFMRDLTPMTGTWPPLARISVWDQPMGETGLRLYDVLNRRPVSASDGEAVWELIERRLGGRR